MTTPAHSLDDFDLRTGRQLVSLARDTVERCVATETVPTPEPETDSSVLARTRGAFVTLERGERLRGCCGRIDPDDPVWQAARAAAVDAARHDPRCPPIQPGECDQITVSTTVLSEPVVLDVDAPAAYPAAIEVGRDGLLVTSDRHRGLLLPQVAVDRGWSERAFLTAACQKAGLPGTAWRTGDVTVASFTARCFEERSPRGAVDCQCYDDGECASTSVDADRSTSPGDRADVESSASDDPAGGNEPLTDGGRPAGGGGDRPPAVAGQFYSSGADPLREQITECFAHDLGPGPLEDVPAPATTPKVVVSPHAGYPYSGPVAAHGYGVLATGGAPDVVVLLGPNHQGVGPAAAVAPHDRWRTPLGDVPVDGELAATLVDSSSVARFDDAPHVGEHSIEVQLPFLQYCLAEVRIVPVCLSRAGEEGARQLGRDLAAVIDETDREVAVVSSTDLTHYEPHDAAVAADEPIREALAAGEPGTIATSAKRGHTMCGPWATVAGMTVAAERGTAEGEVLAYATSGDTTGDRSQVVGYCSAVFPGTGR